MHAALCVLISSVSNISRKIIHHDSMRIYERRRATSTPTPTTHRVQRCGFSDSLQFKLPRFLIRQLLFLISIFLLDCNGEKTVCLLASKRTVSANKGILIQSHRRALKSIISFILLFSSGLLFAKIMKKIDEN